MITGFIRQMSYLPHAHIAATLFCFAYDSVKYKRSLRQEGLLARCKAAVNARGEIWIDPEEAKQLETEAVSREIQTNHTAGLKEHCARKGRSFENENQNYLDQQAGKAAQKKGEACHAKHQPY